MTCYVYCLIEADAPPVEPTEGIDGRISERIAAGPFQAIVSAFETHELHPDKASVFAHERVIDSFLTVTTPLPCRFGTIVSKEKLVQFAADHAPTLAREFNKVRGCVEMGLKVSWPAGESSTLVERNRIPSSEEGPGTQFLRQRLQRHEEQEQTARWIREGLADLIQESTAGTLGKNAAIIRIAHLIRRKHLQTYRERLDTLLQTRPEGAFLKSGPWPPYSFVSTGVQNL